MEFDKEYLESRSASKTETLGVLDALNLNEDEVHYRTYVVEHGNLNVRLRYVDVAVTKHEGAYCIYENIRWEDNWGEIEEADSGERITILSELLAEPTRHLRDTTSTLLSWFDIEMELQYTFHALKREQRDNERLYYG